MSREFGVVAIDHVVVNATDAEASARMVERIDRAKKDGDTLGGAFELRATGMPVGIGSNRQRRHRPLPTPLRSPISRSNTT